MASVKLTVEGVSVVAAPAKISSPGLAFVLGHGAGQDMDSPFMTYFHEELARAGYLSVKFNFPYMEQGRRAPDPQRKLRDTFSAVIGKVLEEFGPSGIVASGKSMGGRVASYIAGDIDAVSGLVFLGYPLHPPGRADKLRDAHLYELDRPMLFVSGTRDSLAKRDLLDRVVGKIGSRGRLHWIEGGDHSFRLRRSDREPPAEALAAVLDWTRRLEGSGKT